MTQTILVRNRPLEHYMLSIFSLVLRGENKIILKSSGSVVGRTLDMVNSLTGTILPNIFNVDFKNSVEKTKIGDSVFSASVITIILRVR